MNMANGREMLVEARRYITHQEHCQIRLHGLVSKGCTCGADHLTKRINRFLDGEGD